MAYFPFFMDLSGKEGLIVGGGIVALRKIEKLLPFGPSLTVGTSILLPELFEIPGLKRDVRDFVPDMLEGKDFAIAATDDREVNRYVAYCCRQRSIPVNVVDDPKECTFLFPALVQRGDLTVGISTGGASPSGAVWLKERVEELLPEQTEKILDYMSAVRSALKEHYAPELRMKINTAAFRACIRYGRPLTEEEFHSTVTEVVSHDGR